MTAIRTDVAPRGPVSLPASGLGRGWEGVALAGIAAALLLPGMVNLYSASAFMAQRQGLPDTFYVLRQAIGAGLGLIALLACAALPHRIWRGLAVPLLFATLAALLVLLLPWTTAIAPEANGARRWLVLFGVSFQPSDVAKVAIVVWTAHRAVEKREHFRSLSRGMLPFLVVWALLALPIVAQPDLSTAVVVVAAGAITLFAAGARIGHFVFLGLMSLPMAPLVLGGFRMDRIRAFLSPDQFVEGAGYQVFQSRIALGSGGIVGVGFGQGRQKFGFLPEPHNDFIFSMIGEEWGLFGVTAVIALYAALVLVGFRIARSARDPFGQLLAVGLTSMIGLHAVLHMAVGLGLVPATGLALPLVSYGRSNLIITLMAIGILLSVARDARARSGP